jgi:hypothetical protein
MMEPIDPTVFRANTSHVAVAKSICWADEGCRDQEGEVNVDNTHILLRSQRDEHEPRRRTGSSHAPTLSVTSVPGKWLRGPHQHVEGEDSVSQLLRDPLLVDPA